MNPTLALSCNSKEIHSHGYPESSTDCVIGADMTHDIVRQRNESVPPTVEIMHVVVMCKQQRSESV